MVPLKVAIRSYSCKVTGLKDTLKQHPFLGIQPGNGCSFSWNPLWLYNEIYSYTCCSASAKVSGLLICAGIVQTVSSPGMAFEDSELFPLQIYILT